MATTKMKFNTRFTTKGEKQGTNFTEPSLTDQSQAEDVDIYQCLKKYGITTLVNKTQATELLYGNYKDPNFTLDEAVRARNELEEYFIQQPARVRKMFGDNVDMFIEKYKMGQFDEMLEAGIVNEEIIKAYQEKENIKIDKPTENVEKEVMETIREDKTNEQK